jgi:hypothetical protein
MVVAPHFEKKMVILAVYDTGVSLFANIIIGVDCVSKFDFFAVVARQSKS